MKITRVVIAAAVASVVIAAQAQDEESYDRNKDGRLDSTERRVYLMHRTDSFFKKYDKNKDGMISPEELEIHRNEYKKKSPWTKQTIREEHLNRRQLPAEMAKMFPVAKKPARTPLDRLWNIQIRRSIDDVDPFFERVGDSDYDKALKQVKPATFSYSRDFEADADIWIARGVIARPILFSEDVFSS